MFLWSCLLVFKGYALIWIYKLFKSLEQQSSVVSGKVFAFDFRKVEGWIGFSSCPEFVFGVSDRSTSTSQYRCWSFDLATMLVLYFLAGFKASSVVWCVSFLSSVCHITCFYQRWWFVYRLFDLYESWNCPPVSQKITIISVRRRVRCVNSLTRLTSWVIRERSGITLTTCLYNPMTQNYQSFGYTIFA